jgi:hypothetical protein
LPGSLFAGQELTNVTGQITSVSAAGPLS